MSYEPTSTFEIVQDDNDDDDQCTDQTNVADNIQNNNNSNEINNDQNSNTALKEKIVQSIYNHLVSKVCIDVTSNIHELIKTGEISMIEMIEPFTRQELYPELYTNCNDEQIQEKLNQYSTEIPPTSNYWKRYHKRRRLLLEQQQQQEEENEAEQEQKEEESKDIVMASTNTNEQPADESGMPAASVKNQTQSNVDEAVAGTATNATVNDTTAAVAAVASTSSEAEATAADTTRTTTTTTSASTSTMQTRQSTSGSSSNSTNQVDIWGRIPSKEPKYNVECRICGRMVSALRFAPHLDKCMGLSMARGAGNSSSNINNNTTGTGGTTGISGTIGSTSINPSNRNIK